MDSTLFASDVSCSRVVAGQPVRVNELTLGLEPGSLNILFGPVEGGRNLVLRLLALMEQPDQGEISFQGESTQAWTEEQRTDFRSRKFGFVFEAPFLLPSFTVLENIAMPLFKLTGAPPEEAREQMDRILGFVGLSDYATSAPTDLPLWAQLRVALARALVTGPVALFVKNLDSFLREDELISFLELLAGVRRAFGTCVLVSAHHADLTSFGTRALEMAEGRIVRDWKPAGLLL
ncbi:MAG: ATP-binding cassette domain-containing protein [Verrucomicrobiota bacterium]